jgi:hypothetical protein
MARYITKTAAWLFLWAGALTISASASPITYKWQGDNGFTGSFTLDTSAFTPNLTSDTVPQTALTAFSFSGPGFTFNLSQVVLSSTIFFNTTVNPPAYVNGGGPAARDVAGDTLSFFPTNPVVIYSPTNGTALTSNGQFAVVAVGTPEPATFGFMLLALFGGFVAKSCCRRSRQLRPAER